MLRACALAASLGLAAAVSSDLRAADFAFDDLVYLSCEEAWAKSGESTETTVEMIRVLAQFTLEKRALVVPEDRGDLSQPFGELIKAFCTADPQGLLFNAVDKAVRRLL